MAPTEQRTSVHGLAGTAGNSGSGIFWNSDHIGASPLAHNCHAAVRSCSQRQPLAGPRTHTPTYANTLLDPTFWFTHRGGPGAPKHAGVLALSENNLKHSFPRM